MPRRDAASYRVALVMELELEHGPALGVAEQLSRVIAESLDGRYYSVAQNLEDSRFSRVQVRRVGKIQIEEHPKLV